MLWLILLNVVQLLDIELSLPLLRRIDIAGKHGETITQAQDRLRLLHRRPYGLWISDGRDAGEYSIRPSQRRCCVQ